MYNVQLFKKKVCFAIDNIIYSKCIWWLWVFLLNTTVRLILILFFSTRSTCLVSKRERRPVARILR